MSDAFELLNNLTEDEIMVYTAEPEIEPHIVVGKDRYIVVPDELKRIAVQYDHNIETVTFDCVRFWDEHDMSEMDVYIVYTRPDGETGDYKAENVTTDENVSDIMHFTWTIKRHVTEVSGSITFQVCVRKPDGEGNLENHWSSEENNEAHVSKGQKCGGEAIEEKYPDIFNQWEEEILESVEDKLEEVEEKIEIPQVTTINLLADSWVKSDVDSYSQVVEIGGVTENSKIDLQPTPEQLSELIDDGISMTAVNDNCIVTIYAIGAVPTADMVMQIVITEVVSA